MIIQMMKEVVAEAKIVNQMMAVMKMPMTVQEILVLNQMMTIMTTTTQTCNTHKNKKTI